METEINNRTVYITNFVAHDYGPAEKFGKLIAITRGYVNCQSLDRVVYGVAEGLKNCQKDDYLLLSGTNIVCVIAATIWMIKHGQVKTLYWDNKRNDYVVLTMKRDNIEKIFEEVEK